MAAAIYAWLYSCLGCTNNIRKCYTILVGVSFLQEGRLGSEWLFVSQESWLLQVRYWVWLCHESVHSGLSSVIESGFSNIHALKAWRCRYWKIQVLKELTWIIYKQRLGKLKQRARYFSVNSWKNTRGYLIFQKKLSTVGVLHITSVVVYLFQSGVTIQNALSSSSWLPSSYSYCSIPKAMWPCGNNITQHLITSLCTVPLPDASMQFHLCLWTKVLILRKTNRSANVAWYRDQVFVMNCLKPKHAASLQTEVADFKLVI